MKVNFSGSCRPQVNILDPGQVNAVLESSYEVLERTGVRVGLPEALSLLEASGASVSGDVVRIPQTLVKRALDSAPPAFDVYGRDGKRSVRIQNGRLYFGPGIDAPFAIDEYTGERRPFLRRDTRTAARLCDALPNMDVAVGMGTITDVPDEIASVYELADLLSWNRKPVIGWGTSLDNLRDMHRIASLVAGGEDKHRVRPLFAFFADPLSPLVHTGEVLKQMLYCADHMIPFLYVSAPLAGGTSPTSLAR
ncbi:MAG: trimethylamine methyltransferase family protein, partial [Chloroflexi bacterium]|nr:trimethylamine methyltransferase family protein [Chloroflexota bacterium]